MENPSTESIIISRPGIEHVILLDAGYLFAAIARAALEREGIGHYFKNERIARIFRINPDAPSRPIVKIENHPGLQRLLIDSARTALGRENTGDKSWVILYYDGVLKKNDGSWNYTKQHRSIQQIPGIFLIETDMRKFSDRNEKQQIEQKNTDERLAAGFNTVRTFSHIQSIVLMSGDGCFYPSLEETKNQKIAVLGINTHETAKGLHQDFEFCRIDLSRLFEMVEVDADWLDIMREKAQEQSAVKLTMPISVSESSQPEPSRASKNTQDKDPQDEDDWSGFKKALLWGLGSVVAIAYAVNR